MNQSPDKEKLLELVRQHLWAAGMKGKSRFVHSTLKELDRLYPAAPWSDLIYWPDATPENPMQVLDPDADPIPEEIVERALTYER